MPAKGRRVASRQAQLGRRKRRSGRVPGEIAPGPATIDLEPGGEEAEPTTESRTPATRVAPRPAPVTAGPRTGGQTRASARLRNDAYNYLGRELRRIGILAAVLLIVLIVLSFLI